MATLKYLVRGAINSSKSPSWAINDPQPTGIAAGRQSILGRRSRSRLGARVIADFQAPPADPKRSPPTASLECAGTRTSWPTDAVGFEKLVRFVLLLYAAQAAIGFGVGFVLPWFFYFGVMHR